MMPNGAPREADRAEAGYVARQQRLTRWQVFQPTTRCCLERVAAVGGPALAEQLAEAIRREATQAHVIAEL